MNELRKSLISGVWMVIKEEKEVYSEIVACPFCPEEVEKEKEIRSIKDKSGAWFVKVIPQKDPLFRIEGEIEKEGIGPLYDRMNNIGASEIVIESIDHNLNLVSMPLWNLELVLKIWKDRIEDLKKDKRFRYILIFRNEGREKFTKHPFSRVIALPFIPKRITEEIKNAQEYFARKERCIFCDLIEIELSQYERLVEENEDFISFVPFTPRFPFEIWIFPKKHSAGFEKESSFSNLAYIFQNCLKRLERVLVHEPSYVIQVHTSENERTFEESFHWHLEIIPKGEKVSDFDRGAEIPVTSSTPEEMASLLRETI